MNKDKCLETVNRKNAVQGEDRNKLRTYAKFKSEYVVEPYLVQTLPKIHRSSIAKFWCGVAPIRIETGRFERLKEEDRVCAPCNVTETEKHVLIDCPFYFDLRFELLQSCKRPCDTFETFNDEDKLNFILANPNVVTISAKTCYSILERYRAF